MATPRKHWFKVADSIGDEDWDNDVLATLIRLQARLNTKWARNGLVGSEAGEITLSAGDAMAVTHRTCFARALPVLRRCSAAVSLVCYEYRAAVKILWPKWPEFQGLIARESPESRPVRKTPPQDARRKTQEEKEPAALPPPSRSRIRAKAPDPRALEAWPAIRAAFAEHGTDLGESVAPDRSDLIAKRLDAGATAADLVQAVHGYVRIHGLDKKPDGYDPRAYFRPKTVFKADGFSDRVDAGRGPRPVSGPSKAERMWGHLR